MVRIISTEYRRVVTSLLLRELGRRRLVVLPRATQGGRVPCCCFRPTWSGPVFVIGVMYPAVLHRVLVSGIDNHHLTYGNHRHHLCVSTCIFHCVVIEILKVSFVM